MEVLALPRSNDHVDPVLVLSNPFHSVRTNSVCPISRLPTELLETIFIHNTRDSYVYEKYGWSTLAVHSAISASHVCHHWRNAALNCPTLWAYIPRTSQRWVQELLVRSKKAPLKFYANFCHGDEPSRVLSVIKQAMNHVERIQTLHLHLYGVGKVCDPQMLSKFLFSCAPCLEHVDILGLDIIEDSEASPSSFKGETLALTTLKLMDCSIPWNSLTLSSLTVLELFSPSSLHTIAEFLFLLRGMPGLVCLSLQEVLLSAHDFISNGEVNSTSTIILPCLSELYVSDPISTIVAFLICVDIPLGARVRLECMGDGTFDVYSIYYRHLSSLLAQRINDPVITGPTIRSMIIHNDDSSDVQLIFSTLECEREVPSMYSTRWDDNTRLCVMLDPINDEAVREVELVLDSFCGSAPLANIRSIHFLAPVRSLDVWRKMSRWLPNLRHIKLSEGCLPDITSLLFLPSYPSTATSGGGDVDRGGNEMFVPHLEELELYSICLSKAPVSVCEDDNLIPPELRSLCEGVSARKGTRCTLSVNECFVHTDGGVVVLELAGKWESNQFKVTSKHTFENLPDVDAS